MLSCGSSLVELVFDVAKNTLKLIFGYIAPRPMFYYPKKGSTPNATINAYFGGSSIFDPRK